MLLHHVQSFQGSCGNRWHMEGTCRYLDSGRFLLSLGIHDPSFLVAVRQLCSPSNFLIPARNPKVHHLHTPFPTPRSSQCLHFPSCSKRRRDSCWESQKQASDTP